jgi:hypothetical protein
MKCNLSKERKIGRKIEMEHAHNFPKSKQKLMAIKISNDHIKEFPCYYSRGLLPMEKKLKRGMK